jgi:hypothetical protein
MTAGEGPVVDPAGERLRDGFKDTRMLHLPMQFIVRVEAIDKRGALAIRDGATGEKIMPFPVMPPKGR